MSITRIRMTPPVRGEGAARVDLVTGALAPRLLARGDRWARVGVTAAQMLLLEGDHVPLEIRVGPGCALSIEDIGGMVAYPPPLPEALAGGRPRPARWSADIRLDAGASLDWHGLPLVVAREADVRRRTEAHLQEGARLLLRETSVLGRHGETGGVMTSTLEITDHAGPVLREETVLDGRNPRPGVLGRSRVLDSVVCAGFRPEPSAGDLVFERPGAMTRALGETAHETSAEHSFLQWRAVLHGSPS